MEKLHKRNLIIVWGSVVALSLVSLMGYGFTVLAIRGIAILVVAGIISTIGCYLPIDDAKKVEEQLSRAGIRVSCDTRSEKVGYKIREAQLEKIPYMLVIGDKEVEEGTVSVRSRKEGDLGSMPVEGFLSKILQEIATKAK